MLPARCKLSGRDSQLFIFIFIYQEYECTIHYAGTGTDFSVLKQGENPNKSTAKDQSRVDD